MAQLPGEIAIQDLKTGEVYYGPPGTPFDRTRFKIAGENASPSPTPEPSAATPAPAPQAQAPAGEMFGPPQNLPQALVRQAAAPTIGGAIGTAAGVPLAPVTFGFMNPVTMGAVGSMAGEALNQYGPEPFRRFIGLEGQPPSPLSVGAAGAVPAALGVAKRFFNSLPGAAVGLQDWVFSKLGPSGEKLIAKFAPTPGTASQLFTQASKEAGQSNLTINTAAFGTAVKAMESEVAKIKIRPGTSLHLLGDAKAFIQGDLPEGVKVAARRVPFDEFRANQSQLGRVIRNLESTEGVELGQAKKLYSAMWDDLDTAATAAKGKAGATLRSAVDAYKREQAAEDVRDFFIKSVSDKAGRPALNVDTLSTKIARNRDYLESKLSSSEVDDLLSTVRKFSDVPLPGLESKLGFSGTGFAQRAIVGGMAGAVAGEIGLGGAGMLGGTAGGVLAVEALSMALSTPPGRALVRTMADQGMSWHQIGSVLLQGGLHTGRAALLNPTVLRPSVVTPGAPIGGGRLGTPGPMPETALPGLPTR